MSQANIDAISEELLALLGSGRERARLTDTWPGLDLPAAYRVADAVRQRRVLGGDRWAGRKIGFTNHHMWDAYDVKAPIWGPMYEGSIRQQPGSQVELGGFPNPKIEPEIIFGIAAPLHAGMDEQDIAGCIDWISLGFELVSSIYPGWKFQASDAVAAFGLHASLVVGERIPVASGEDWIDQLAGFEVRLLRDGVVVAEGGGVDVLGSPLSALRHLNEIVSNPAYGPPLAAGEIITTGTLTLAMSVAPGESWTAEASGIDLPPISALVS